MTSKDTRDMSFEDKLRSAFDEVEPSPEAQARMLAALKQAQASSQGSESESASPSTSAQAFASPDAASLTEAASQGPAKAPRKRIAPWKVALPAAACLALAAIGVGVVGSIEPADMTDSTMPASAEIATDGGFYDTAAKGDYLEAADESAAMAMADIAIVEGFEGFNTEEYAAITEGGFTSTAISPLSTVSADVDTASYCNLRRMIGQGQPLDQIPSGSVRIEEMLNYFSYDYAEPQGTDRFSIQAKVGPCPWNDDTQLLVLGFATATEVVDKPANLVFLIDVSGSMDDPDKLPLLQDSFATLLEHLDADDRVSIVTYSGNEEIALEGAAGDDERSILRAIYRLQADGSTNGEAGLKMAYDVAKRNYIEGGVNRIIMASDGDLNVGMTSESDLFDFVQDKRDTGIYLSVLGFGWGNYKDTKMETLADNGNGQYHYIDCIEEAERVLSHNLMSNIVPFADDVKVQLEFNPRQVKGYRLIGYENRELAAEDFLDDEKDAGDIGPNAQFTVAYEIVPASSSMEIAVPELRYGQDAHQATDAQANGESASDEWLNCSLRYRAFDDGKVHQQELSVTGAEGTNDDWSFAAAVIEAAMVLRDSSYAGSATLESAQELLRGIELSSEQAEFLKLLQRAQALEGEER